MSKSIKGLLVLALAGAAANSALAQDGQIKFTGKIIAASCTATGGGTVQPPSGGTPQVITVPMGDVSIAALNSSQGGANIVAGKSIALTLDCDNVSAGLKTVRLTFQPSAGTGTGLDTNNTKLLATQGSATGVGIGLFDVNNQLMDLGNPNLEVTGNLDPPASGSTISTATLNLRAAYVQSSATAPTAGTADAILPFTLNYQ